MKKKQLSIYSLALASLLVLPLGSLTSCSEHGMGSLSQCNVGESECNKWCGKQYAYCDFGR